ncbi:MAG: CapA family protein [Clostridia bacterium]|nr:CapA family protein [Clostridia bacterium]
MINALANKNSKRPENPQKNEAPTEEKETLQTSEDPLPETKKEAPKVISTATIGNSGDVLIHNTVLKASLNKETGKYDFNRSFELLKPYVSASDYAVVNAEFSVSVDNTYSALPFRVPSTIVEALKNCGYDMGLCANNHIADGGIPGIQKTMATLEEYGMDFTGSRKESADKRYFIKEIDGIQIGMLNYSYSSAWNTNSFSSSNLNTLYQDAEVLIKKMREEGAELIYLYIHWGEEYSLTPNETQEAIAQKMCDLGVDVIVGGHPHKIQPLELIESQDKTHKTICLYSFGNLFSGQQIEHMAGGTKENSPHCYQDSWHFPGCDWPDVDDRTTDEHRLEHGPTCNDNGHTEDGLFFTVTASKYDDGTVLITGVDILPTWCMGRGLTKRSNPVDSSFDEYTVIPLDKSKDWIKEYGLSEFEKTEAEYSYNRTMALVGEGLKTINASCKAEVENFLNP